MEKIFYQSSLPRAGSTVLQNILAQNPDIYATPTSGVLELIFAARANYTTSPEFKAQDKDVMKNAFQAFCKEGVEAFFNAITDKKYIIDKSRGWGIHRDFLQFVMDGEPRIICVVRDLRDIFASMEGNFRKHPDKQSDILEWSTGKGTTVPKRIDIWSQSPPVGLAIERLGEIIRMNYDSKLLFVKFEDLCLYPDQEMRRIYDYLEIPFYSHDFDNIQQVTKEDDEVYGAFGDHVIRTKLEPVRSRSKELLGKEVNDWVYNNYRWFFDKFRYTK
jgi:sulfotransferase